MFHKVVSIKVTNYMTSLIMKHLSKIQYYLQKDYEILIDPVDH